MQRHSRHTRPEDHNRLVIFFVCAALVMGLSYLFITKPAIEKAQQQKGIAAESVKETTPAKQEAVAALVTVDQALAATKNAKRIDIDTPQVQGSVSLQGLRFDDLQLKDYAVSMENKTPVRLLAPSSTKQTFFVEVGLMPADNNMPAPTQDTVWQVVSGSKLTPETPIVLEWDNGHGLKFTRTVTIDRRYLISVSQAIQNTTDDNVTFYPYALVSQSHHMPVKGEKLNFEDQPSAVQHIGPIGFLNDKLQEESYEDVKDEQFQYKQTKGWLGITSKYWLVSLLPSGDQVFDARFSHQTGDMQQDIYQTDMRGQPLVVMANETAKTEMRFFAGAKKLQILNEYEDQLKVDRFDLAVDFGVLYFLTKPLYYFLSMLGEFFHDEFKMAASFGLALLVMTVILRGLTFPLQNKAYRSMNKMKDLAPKIHALKEKHGEDKAKFQQEMMALYKREKINPASGCLPILLQIPIFFALYKVIYITLDMRHAPFWGWVHDLSAPDPTNVFNLFGLLHFNTPEFMVIGAWPLLYGITMYLQQRLNPQPEDPVQKQVFALMPWMFMFIFAKFPAGLVIYYTWSNVLGILQQYSLRKINADIAPPKKPKKKKHDTVDI